MRAIIELKNKKLLEQNRRKRDQAEIELHQAQHQLQRVDNRIAYLESANRKRRAHHLITRGAAVESIAPEVKVLTEPDFYDLMERILTSPSATELIRDAVSIYAVEEGAEDQHEEDES